MPLSSNLLTARRSIMRHRSRRGGDDMAQVQTLGGPIDTGQLGTVLMHEHIFNLTPELQGPYPGFHGWDPDVEVPKAQQTLKELKDAGYDTILELSVVGLGRDVRLMQRAIEGSGLQVIA